MLTNDVRYGWRTLRRWPVFTAAAVLTLALGIGANTLIFAVVDGVLLRPLPFKEPETLFQIWERNLEMRYAYMYAAPPNVADWIEQSTVFDGIATYVPGNLTLTRGDVAERLRGTRVSANTFSLLGVAAQVGRTFLAADGAPGAPAVVVLSWGLWQNRFGGAPEVVGHRIEINGTGHTVIGIMPATFRFPPPIALEGTLPQPTQLWLCAPSDYYRTKSRYAHHLFTFGRLKAGIDLETARKEMQGISGRLQQEYPQSNKGWTTVLVPLAEQVTESVRPALLLLLAAVGLVLLLACANVANLLLTRAVSRQKEIAIRASLGAGPVRLTRQLFTESTLLALLGGLAGLVLAILAVEVLGWLAPPNLPRLEEVGVNWRVLGFNLLICLAAGLLFGLAPVVQVRQLSVHESLKERTQGTGQRRTLALRKGLVICEVLLAVIVLVGAGLLLKSLYRLRSVDPGFRPQNVLTLTTTLPEVRYPEPERRAQFVGEVRRAIEALPEVRHAGTINEIPLAEDRQGTIFLIDGEPQPERGQEPKAHIATVSPGYFRAMGITITRGRSFNERDRPESPPVLVVNEALAQRYFPNQDPIGKRLLPGWTPMEIVGLVGNVRHDALAHEPTPNIYRAYLQRASARQVTFVVRTASKPYAVLGAIREIIRTRDPALPLDDVRTMENILGESIAQERFMTLLLCVFAGLGLLLAAVGIYGVVSYSVSHRFREMGIRLAFGARGASIVGLVIAGAMRLVGIGILIGLAGALLVSRLFATVLFGVSPTDVPILVTVALLIAAVALLASYLPARRATQVDPVVCLRAE